MACISAETGTMAFAIINMVMFTISSALGIGLLGFWYFVYVTQISPAEGVDTVGAGILTYFGQLAAILIFLGASLVSLLFASFLMNGILKKKPEHIKVYYIYGVVKVIVASTLFLCACVASGGALDPIALVIASLSFCIYSLILYMLRYTYVQYETSNAQFGHTRLDEKC